MRWARDHELTANMTGKVDARYMAEVELMTDQRVRDYDHAQRRLQAAERRAEKLEQQRTTVKQQRALRVAWELVEFRRQELAVLDGIMRSSPASSQHRGTASYRKVPVTHVSLPPNHPDGSQ